MASENRFSWGIAQTPATGPCENKIGPAREAARRSEQWRNLDEPASRCPRKRSLGYRTAAVRASPAVESRMPAPETERPRQEITAVACSDLNRRVNGVC